MPFFNIRKKDKKIEMDLLNNERNIAVFIKDFFKNENQMIDYFENRPEEKGEEKILYSSERLIVQKYFNSVKFFEAIAEALRSSFEKENKKFLKENIIINPFIQEFGMNFNDFKTRKDEIKKYLIKFSHIQNQKKEIEKVPSDIDLSTDESEQYK